MEFVKLFRERATKAGLPYTAVDVQAAASYTAWQLLEIAVTATKSLDDKVLAQWLKANRPDTLTGKLRFDGPNNYGDDLSKVKQVQDGKWLVVWPKEYAAPGSPAPRPVRPGRYASHPVVLGPRRASTYAAYASARRGPAS